MFHLSYRRVTKTFPILLCFFWLQLISQIPRSTQKNTSSKPVIFSTHVRENGKKVGFPKALAKFLLYLTEYGNWGMLSERLQFDEDRVKTSQHLHVEIE